MRRILLIVDDSKTVRQLARKAFKPHSCELIEARDGAEGLELAGRLHPDLIFLDHTMPVMDGPETLARLKANASTKDIPVILFARDAGGDTLAQVASRQARDFVVKPFSTAHLVEKARAVIDLDAREPGTVVSG